LRSERGTTTQEEVKVEAKEENKVEEGVDMYDIVKAKDISEKFGDEWIEQVSQIKVWNIKKSKLE
jgi:hypothetical protein